MSINEADGDKTCECSCGSLCFESDTDQDIKTDEHKKHKNKKDKNDENMEKGRQYTWFNENGRLMSRKLTNYESHLEDEVQKLQDALFSISSHYAKIQFRLRQIAGASGNERLCLLRELQRITCQGIDSSRNNDELPTLMSDAYSMGDVRARQQKILTQLRKRLSDLAEVTDSGFCIESESSYNFRKYERSYGTTPCEITSDGTVEHGKYCPCIMCREEFCRESACKRGYLAETWPKLCCSEDEHRECQSKTKSKSKKKRQKQKSRKLDKISPRRSSRRGSLNRYYRMPSEGNRQDSPNAGKNSISKSQRATLTSINSGGIRGSSIRGKPPGSRHQSETALISQLSGKSLSQSVGKRSSQRSSSQRGPQGSVNRISIGEKGSGHRSRQASPNETSGVGSSPSQRSTLASPSSSPSLGKNSKKRSQQESISSSTSGGKSLGRKSPLLSISARRNNIDGSLPFLKRTSLESLGNQESKRQSKLRTSKASLDSKRSLMSARKSNPDKRELGSKVSDKGIHRQCGKKTMLSKLSCKLTRRCSKKASISKKKPSYLENKDEDQNEERQSVSANKRDESPSFREDIEDDQQYEGKIHKGSILRKLEGDANEDKSENRTSRNQEDIDEHQYANEDSQSLRSYAWKQPLVVYSTNEENRHYCKKSCRGKCAKSGQCGRIHDCLKKFEAITSKKSNAILKMCSALGFSQMHTPHRISSRSYQELNQYRVEAHRNRRKQNISRDTLDEDQFHYESQESRISIKRGQRSVRSSPENEYDKDRGESTRSRKVSKKGRAQSIAEKELDEDQDQDKSKRSSTASKKGNRSIQRSPQDEYDQSQIKSERMSAASNREQRTIRKNPKEEYDKDQGESTRSSKVSKNERRHNIPEEELNEDLDPENSKRNSTASKRTQRSLRRSSQDKDREGSTRSSKVSKNGRSQNISDEELDEDQDKDKSKRNSTSSRKTQRSVRSISQEEYDKDRKESTRSSKVSKNRRGQSIPEEELNPDRLQENIKRISTASRRDQSSVRRSSQEEFDLDRQESSRSSRVSKHRRDQNISDEELDSDQDKEKSKRNSTASKTTQRSVRRSSQEDYAKDQEESARSSKVSKYERRQNISVKQLDEDQDVDKSKRSSASSRRTQRSVRSSSQEEYGQDRAESTRSSNVSRNEMGQSISEEESDENRDQEYTERSSNPVKSGWRESIRLDEIDLNREEMRRSSKSFNKTRGLLHSRLINSLSNTPKDPIQNKTECLTPAPSAIFTRSMVEMTTNIERDNTNRTNTIKKISQRRETKKNCTKTVNFEKCPCPCKNQEKKTEKKFFSFSFEARQCKLAKPQENTSTKNQTCDSKCHCVKPQCGHHQLLRPFSHHSMLELPLLYPRAIGKPRKMTKCERKDCKDASWKGRKYFEELSKQVNNPYILKAHETQTPTTSTKQSKFAEKPSAYKDPMEDDVYTDC
ncbi:serine/arginine repetitive matrix protein 2 isoform X2 [Drosophila innubila]|uniref:serine/arginine repetitive matrix protein 2 isoform X2 n=1 Tax=Drosophila innubila TaxID=198719 RepID=UPI00148C79CD|nr:serine/arginine repetitive matrix protein 2 isoform X2 [Drosophila innubila]